jgi:hypothetical protein
MQLVKTLVIVIFAAVLFIGAAQEQARITAIDFRPATTEEGGGVVINLRGTGRCTYMINFGDGQSDTRTANLPDQLIHKYTADAEYEVVATPEAPCQGVARAKIDIRAIQRGIWGINAELASAGAPEIVLKIEGRGTCAISIDFGDKQIEKHDLTLPAKVPHKYLKGGSYAIHARTQEPCRGEGRVNIDIKS